MNDLILGVTGSIVSGKGIFSKSVASQGFELFSFGEEVRNFIEEDLNSKGPNEREKQQYWGNQARLDFGVNFWTSRIIAKISDEGNYVIDGFRYPDQIQHFQETFGERFKLVGVDAFIWTRWRYCQARNREGDPKTFREFEEADRKDKFGYLDGTGQNTEDCLKIARNNARLFYNHQSKENLMREAIKFVHDLSKV